MVEALFELLVPREVVAHFDDERSARARRSVRGGEATLVGPERRRSVPLDEQRSSFERQHSVRGAEHGDAERRERAVAQDRADPDFPGVAVSFRSVPGN